MTVEPVLIGGTKTVTVERAWGSVSVTIIDDIDGSYNFANVIGDLFRPAAFALGYQNTVDDYMPEVYG